MLDGISRVVSRNTDDRQHYGNFIDAGNVAHYTLARLVQRTTSLSARVNFTASPTLSFQVYAEQLVSKGEFSNVRELNDPRADTYDARFKPYTDPAVTASPGGVLAQAVPLEGGAAVGVPSRLGTVPGVAAGTRG